MKEEAVNTYRDNEDFMDKLTAELGSVKALGDMLCSVRFETVWTTPKTRNNFNPSAFLNDHFKKDNLICMDYDNINDD